MIHTLLEKRFNGTGNLIYMATSYNNQPSIRSLTPFYHQGNFYVITQASSNKTHQIYQNPNVAICGYFFNAAAIASIIGPMKNFPDISEKLIAYCHDWITLGNIDIQDEDTVILKIQITKGYIVDKKKRYEINFS